MTEDRETEHAIQALTYRLQARGEADIEIVAREFMIELRARGWRPTEARVHPGWQRLVQRAEPTPEWHQARAELEAHLAERKPGDAA